ncbi:hypothetical protein BV22DRAFT_1200330 [Leucogyrophana mollusca]|uniref:Uncharacterized protein n=2 Tax=Leucogyrophana mollusca TaxID=85980 RepID=A0ACB8AV23_9AGAM|nr:hypothetical protein BV22DRAFT_1135589 [Leucogyrophana mollusca]KAH7917230.1 hypothetical protein BV22DRAFT_1200330 [Leucogyrophana mollusca]
MSQHRGSGRRTPEHQYHQTTLGSPFNPIPAAPRRSATGRATNIEPSGHAQSLARPTPDAPRPLAPGFGHRTDPASANYSSSIDRHNQLAMSRVATTRPVAASQPQPLPNPLGLYGPGIRAPPRSPPEDPRSQFAAQHTGVAQRDVSVPLHPLVLYGPGVAAPPRSPPTRQTSTGGEESRGRHAQHAMASGERHEASSQHLTLQKDLDLESAIAAASLQTKESPWYAVWVLCLKDHLFYDASTKSASCVLAPQYSLDRTFDIYDDEDGPADGGGDEYTPEPKKREQKRTVKPKEGTKELADNDTRTHEGKPKPTGSRRKTERSRRIPDFCQLLRYHLPNAARADVSTRVIMIVEIKPHLPGDISSYDREGHMHSADFQVQEQASYGFAQDPGLDVLPVIIAFGASWKYLEIRRHEIPTTPEGSQRHDPNYHPSPSPHSTSSVSYSPPNPSARAPSPPASALSRLTKRKMFNLNDPQSEVIFGMILNRLRELNGDIWK